jgi:hypothetical protein
MSLAMVAQITIVGIVTGQTADKLPDIAQHVQSLTQSSTNRLGTCGDSDSGSTGLPRR